MFFVRPLVPKPGIDTAVIEVSGSERILKDAIAVKSAKVESKPPESPITALFIPVCSRRLARPCACIAATSSQRFSRAFCVSGTKGVFGIARSKVTGRGFAAAVLREDVPVPETFCSSAFIMRKLFAEKMPAAVFCRLSASMLSISISRTI